MSEEIKQNPLLGWVAPIQEKFSSGIKGLRESAPNEVEFLTNKSTAKLLLKELKTMEGGFVHLADLTAYDESKKEKRFHVLYELISMNKKLRAAVIVECESNESPTVESVCDLWPGANWLERETFDMFGIFFEGHPELRRILLPDSFKGHPLRKDFDVIYRQEFPRPKSTQEVINPFSPNVIKNLNTKTTSKEP